MHESTYDSKSVFNVWTSIREVNEFSHHSLISILICQIFIFKHLKPMINNNRRFCRLTVNMPISVKRWRMYFLWLMKIPPFDLRTSLPRIFFQPRSFISNSRNNFSLRSRISSSIISSDNHIIHIDDQACDLILFLLREQCMIWVTLFITEVCHSCWKPSKPKPRRLF